MMVSILISSIELLSLYLIATKKWNILHDYQFHQISSVQARTLTN